MARVAKKGRSSGGGKKRAKGRRGSPKRATRAATKRASQNSVKVAGGSTRRRPAPASGSKGDIAGLRHDLKKARERQAATAEILNVIARSPGDLKPVLDAIVRASLRVVKCDQAFLFLCEGASFHVVATAARNGAFDAVDRQIPIDPAANFPSRAIVTRKTVYYPDWSLIEITEHDRHVQERFGTKSSLFLPLLRGEECVGLFALAAQQTNLAEEGDIALAESFRDQAVIALENARLFNETNEALERQTATSDILKVIASSPSDVQPVFDAIAESARRVVGGHSATVTRVLGGQIHLASFTTTGSAGREALTSVFPQSFSAQTVSGLVVSSGRVVMHADTEREGDDTTRRLGRARGFRSVLGVPMLRDGIAIGTINVTRVEPGGFDENAIGLMKTFADQAVIAIENARLFNETKEALARQTATADVLKVIASSPSNLQPVFDAIAERSKALIGGHSTTVVRYIDGTIELASYTPVSPEADAALQALFPIRPAPGDRQYEQILRGEIARIADAEVEVEDPAMRGAARARGWRSRLMVPLKGDAGVIGWISITRKEPGPFADKDVDLVSTFADQVVIAIQNVELFEEVRAKTRDLEESLQQQTATADVLKVISRSTFNLQAVLDALVKSAVLLCNADTGIIRRRDGDLFPVAATFGLTEEQRDYFARYPQKPDRGSVFGRAILEERTIHVSDFLADSELDPRRRQDYGGAVAIRGGLGVPLRREGAVVGVFTLQRREAGSFTDKQIELMETFADQAVIAIENARLFEEVQERTRELSKSLDDLRAAQDRLVQTEKLASLGQLTAGIAHEIKNPLNFVNNFSALSVELTDELNEVLQPAELAEKIRQEVGELTSMLKSNLEKVVQHGKRADSIVRNMLLHSREGGGERRSVDFNALVEESLNLAYHGARAERSDFQIALERDLDPGAGKIELYPQEITRALLNMISNGFYAAVRRAFEAGSGFEPTLHAATKGHPDRVEIRIRDNGSGIPPDVKDKMFNPFFTTKPAGEGTGLGLSMSHDIIVKQHGGTIDVATEPGRFTEFIIVLPRADGPQRKR